MKIEVTHNGISEDNDVELKTWRFKFFRTDGTTPLTNSEMSNIFANYYIYLDDGDGIWDQGTDTEVTATTSTSGNEVTFGFTDGDSDVAIAYGTPENYFLVVEMTAGWPSAGLSGFRAQFDPDGYGSGDYNEVENSGTDKIVTIQERGATMTKPVLVPEFQNIIIPSCMFISLFIIFKWKARRKKSKI